MGEVLESAGDSPGPEILRTRRLCRLAESFHTVGYYTPEIAQLTESGFRGWWHAYFGYRFAPLGAANVELVTSTAYNFAPRMVAKAIPSAWSVMSPEAVLERHRQLVAGALGRIFADSEHDATFAELAPLLREAVTGLPVPGRPLFAAHAALEWPSAMWEFGDDRLDAWHACTLIREYRFDGHNAALLAADVDAVGAHVLMAAFGHGRPDVIERIRGWDETEWAAAVEKLVERGWIVPDTVAAPEFTELGRTSRAAIERDTDSLARAILDPLSDGEAERLHDLLASVVEVLITSGEVAGVWPPPTVL